MQLRDAPMARDVARNVCMGGCSAGNVARGGSKAASATKLSWSSANSCRSLSLGGKPARSRALPSSDKTSCALR